MFKSILFSGEPTNREDNKSKFNGLADCIYDFHLDQIFEPILNSKKKYDLKEIFYSPLDNVPDIKYRQEILSDLEDMHVRTVFSRLSDEIFSISAAASKTAEEFVSTEPMQNRLVGMGLMLSYISRYCRVLEDFTLQVSGGILESQEQAPAIKIQSQGLMNFITYVTELTKSTSFITLQQEASDLNSRFSQMDYCMFIKDGTIKIRKYDSEENYSAILENDFAKFRQKNAHDYRHELSEKPSAMHIEEAVLNMLSRICPDDFSELNIFCEKNMKFCNQAIAQFANDIQFYFAWLDFIAPDISSGLHYCYPEICKTSDNIHDNGFFDIALAHNNRSSIVTNDFRLDTPERAIVITGPNQGGKTTFARSIGQLNYLFLLGLSVPGSNAALFPVDNIFAHFERTEDINTLNGKLQDELVRLNSIIQNATSDSLIIINEIFASTTLDDALELGQKMMLMLKNKQCISVIVTFLDELSTGNDVVSMTGTVLDDADATRTYKIIRKEANGLAYAQRIAQKHGLTYEQLKMRLCKL